MHPVQTPPRPRCRPTLVVVVVAVVVVRGGVGRAAAGALWRPPWYVVEGIGLGLQSNVHHTHELQQVDNG